ncbi:uncharacterized protein BDV17DRAFT_288950 [Aspergillus undulatus]|uniref:uncharacterized protein n=1 Tax=Aspergillus undulatus TaxID=1810928 RepID=UPI003CCC95A6
MAQACKKHLPQEMSSWNAPAAGMFDTSLLTAAEFTTPLWDPVKKLYSKIATHEPLVFSYARNFGSRLTRDRNTGKLLNLSHACVPLAINVATTATFQNPSNYLENPNFNENLFNIQKPGLVDVPLFAHLPAPLR